MILKVAPQHNNRGGGRIGAIRILDEQNIIIKIIYFQIKKKKSVIHMDSTYDNRTNPDNTY